MDFNTIRALGEQTNRVIELENQIAAVNKLAKDAMEDQSSKITISLNHANSKSRESAIPHSDMLEEMIKDVLPKHFKGGVSVKHISSFSVGPLHNINLDGNYQMIVFDALIKAMRQEQADLKKSIAGMTNSKTS